MIHNDVVKFGPCCVVRPAAVQWCSKEPLWVRLNCFPPSMTHLMDMYFSARLLVWFEISCGARDTMRSAHLATAFRRPGARLEATDGCPPWVASSSSPGVVLSASARIMVSICCSIFWAMSLAGGMASSSSSMLSDTGGVLWLLKCAKLSAATYVITKNVWLSVPQVMSQLQSILFRGFTRHLIIGVDKWINGKVLRKTILSSFLAWVLR